MNGLGGKWTVQLGETGWSKALKVDGSKRHKGKGQFQIRKRITLEFGSPLPIN